MLLCSDDFHKVLCCQLFALIVTRAIIGKMFFYYLKLVHNSPLSICYSRQNSLVPITSKMEFQVQIGINYIVWDLFLLWNGNFIISKHPVSNYGINNANDIANFTAV